MHVSGHCNEGELLYMYNIVKPKCAMPIHGENRHLVANGLIAVKTGVDPKNVVLAEDGDVVDLYHGQAAVVGSVPCGYVYVDGDSVGEITDEELEKRRILGTEGFVSSFVVVDTEPRVSPARRSSSTRSRKTKASSTRSAIRSSSSCRTR